MPNKKKQRNSFYYFMKELQEKLAYEGQNVSMAKMPEFAHPVWKKMSLAEKEKYEIMAKGFKLEYQRAGRLASDGTSIIENMEIEERKEEMRLQMRQSVIDFLRAPGTKEDFIAANSRKKIYFATFNILCFVEGGMYIPTELGITEYSVQEGITGEFHKFIYPGQIPKGYTGEARRHSDATHQIPITGHEGSEKDYRKIWREFVNFVSRPPSPGNDRVLPPVFCLRDSMDQTLGSLEWLAQAAGAHDYIEELKVWDASNLLMEVRAGVESAVPSYGTAEELLLKNTFDYIPNTRCNFHEDLDSTYCALAHAKRLCYLMSDAVCHLFKVVPTENHLPLRAMSHKPYEVYIPNFKNLSLSTTNERGIGRGVSSHGTRSSLEDTTCSSLHDRIDSRLHERTEPNFYPRTISPISDYEPKPSRASDSSDSENSPPGSSMDSSHKLTTASSEDNAVPVRQPTSISIAQKLARVGQSGAVIPGKGIGRGQRKLP